MLNQQSFMNFSKEEPAALTIWIEVFMANLNLIIHKYKDFELIDLLLLKLPWFNEATAHGKCFTGFEQFAFAVFPY